MKSATALLKQKIRQFLVHSFLYYQKDEPIISDTAYDALCLELTDLLQSHAQQGKDPLRNLVEQALDHEASGFAIRHYPSSIMSAAMHCLYQIKYADLMSFSEFLDRTGYLVVREAV